MSNIRMLRRAQAPDGDRGAAMVEFALVLPILLLLTLGIINFGYLFGQQLSLNQAVREGARAAVVARLPRSSRSNCRTAALASREASG